MAELAYVLVLVVPVLLPSRKKRRLRRVVRARAASGIGFALLRSSVVPGTIIVREAVVLPYLRWRTY